MRASSLRDGFFAINLKSIWRQGSLSAQLAGNGPFLIDKETGELHVLGAAKPLKEYLDHYVISKSKK